MERTHRNEESPSGFFFALIASVTTALLTIYSLISLTSLQLPSPILTSCQLGPGLFNITVFTLGFVFFAIFTFYLHQKRKHELTMARTTCYFKMLRTLLGPLMLSLSLIALGFWKYLVYPCKIEYNQEGEAISFTRSLLHIAVVPASTLLFSLFVSIIICVLITINRFKRRFRNESHWVTHNINSTNRYVRSRIRNAFLSDSQYNDISLTEALLARP